VKLHDILPIGRAMVPIVCPLKFVQGYRCNRCPWARLLPECHTPWAVPLCEEEAACEAFRQHRCVKPDRQLVVIQ
jgi:hypothetical protein